MGVESLIYNLSGIKYEMAEYQCTVGDSWFKDLGVKARPNLVVLRRTKMPAILVEVGFINSDSDNTLSIRTSMILRRQLQMESWIRWKKKGSGNQKAQETVRPHRNPEGLLLTQILLLPFLLLTFLQNQMLVP